MEITGSGGEIRAKVDAFVENWVSSSAYIIAHTSGSTGIPKEIRLLKSDALASARMTCDFLGLHSGSLMGLILSPDYIAGKMMIVRAMVNNATLWAEEPSNRPLDGFDTSLSMDLLAAVPSQLDHLLSVGKLACVKNLIVGGAPLSNELEIRLLDAGINGYVTYGMTETCSHVALRKFGEDFYQGLPGIDFTVDGRGCLVIECGHLSIGRLVTNDIVELRDHRSFRWIGRVDNMINSGGIKLFPEEIEMRISRIVSDQNYYLASRKSERWGEEMVMVTEDDGELPVLYDNICKVLNPMQRPKAIIRVSKLERTEVSDKIKRIDADKLSDIIEIFEPRK